MERNHYAQGVETASRQLVSVVKRLLRNMLQGCALAGLLSACVAPQGTFLVDLPSAEVETREGPGAAELSEPTRIVVLGTGTPIPDARRAGSSIAIIHKGEMLTQGKLEEVRETHQERDLEELFFQLIAQHDET